MLAMSGADLNAKNKNDETPSGKEKKRRIFPYLTRYIHILAPDCVNHINDILIVN